LLSLPDDKQAIAMAASQLINDSDGTSWLLFGKRKSEQAHYLNRKRTIQSLSEHRTKSETGE